VAIDWLSEFVFDFCEVLLQGLSVNFAY